MTVLISQAGAAIEINGFSAVKLTASDVPICSEKISSLLE